MGLRGEEEAIWGPVKNSGFMEIGVSHKESCRQAKQMGCAVLGTSEQHVPQGCQCGSVTRNCNTGLHTELTGQLQPFCIPGCFAC